MRTPGGHDHGHHHDHHHHHDHNLRAAYLHVLADALTSVLAIVALLAGKYLNAVWLDPAMGLVGAALVARWSYGLIRDSSAVLLDRQVDEEREAALRQAIEGDGAHRVTDLHLWQIGHALFAAEVTIESAAPLDADAYRAMIPRELHVVHATIEVRRLA